ncbi:hypothetical protein H2204_008724 [Knufia peltigerae]|uniref:Uncharacterized protein n=1 Tax=Knufia peltigerae TaxID=1002370 RepID=A0AA38XZM3_9EURO|nr:hypothetical protein H2204_008724 [Knufia peltigerae]
MYHLVLIWRFCNKFNRVMASRERRVGSLGESDSGVLLPLYEIELVQLRQQLGDNLSDDNEIMFLYASLQLRCYYFLESYARASSREGILKAYRSAVDVIWRCHKRDTDTQLFRRGPVIFRNALSIASVFVLKTLRSSNSQLVDAEEGRRAFNVSLSLLRKCSIEDNDLPGRFSKILSQLWCATPPESSPQRGLNVTSRLGGSVLHDTLWTWREKFGGQARDGQRPQVSAFSGPRTSAPSSSNRTWPGASPDEQGHRKDVSHPTTSIGQPHHEQSAPLSGNCDMVDLDLDSELNNDWFWNEAGLSSLLTTDFDALCLPEAFNTNSNFVGHGASVRLS